MDRKPRLVTVDDANFGELPCCGIKSPTHPGRCEKRRWLQEQAKFGVRAKTLLSPEGEPAGYVESIPGEFAWRGVDAAGYLFIHCIWIHSKRYHRRGWGAFMIDDCLADARSAGRKGVAILVRGRPWSADARLFLANGFEVADTVPPDYQLLVRKFDPTAASPVFRSGFEQRVRAYSRGMTIVRAKQCPHIAKFASEIAAAANDEFGIRPKLVELESWQDAQRAPTPYAVFAIINNGRLLADHQISRTRFRNIMRAEQ